MTARETVVREVALLLWKRHRRTIDEVHHLKRLVKTYPGILEDAREYMAAEEAKPMTDPAGGSGLHSHI